MRLVVICLMFFIFSCNERKSSIRTSSPTDYIPDTTINIDKKAISDSEFALLFFRGESERILYDFKINTATQIGIYCTTLIGLNKYKQASDILVKVKPESLEESLDGSRIPIYSTYTNPFIFFALLRLNQCCGGFTFSDMEELYRKNFQNFQKTNNSSQLEKYYKVEYYFSDLLKEAVNNNRNDTELKFLIAKLDTINTGLNYQRFQTIKFIVEDVSGDPKSELNLRIGPNDFESEFLCKSLIELEVNKPKLDTSELDHLIDLYRKNFDYCNPSIIRYRYKGSNAYPDFINDCRKCIDDSKNADSLKGRIYECLHYLDNDLLDSAENVFSLYRSNNKSYQRFYRSNSLKEKEFEIFEVINLRLLLAREKVQDFKEAVKKINYNSILGYPSNDDENEKLKKVTQRIFFMNHGTEQGFESFYRNNFG